MKPVKEMTDEELRDVVAELCGWRMRPTPWWTRWIFGKRMTFHPDQTQWLCGYLPDYARSLDAMHEAELFLQKEAGPMAWMDYVDVLRREARGWGGAGAEVSATARERAEAFVETMRKKR